MDDTISRAAALDTLNGIEISRNASWYEFYQKAITAVGTLPPAQPGWIPVAEGLPGKYEYVLLTCERNGKIAVDFGCISPDINGNTSWWIAAHDSKEGWRVCAWMPLPEPWKGEKE